MLEQRDYEQISAILAAALIPLQKGLEQAIENRAQQTEEKILGVVTERFERIEQRLDVLETRMDALSQRMDALDERMEVLEGRMEVLEGRMEVLEARMDSLEQRMDVLEQRMDSLVQRVDSLENRMDLLEETVASIGTRVSALEEQTAQLNHRLDAHIRETQTLIENRALKTEELLLSEIIRVHESMDQRISHVEKELSEIREFYHTVRLDSENSALFLRMINDLDTRVTALEERSPGLKVRFQ